MVHTITLNAEGHQSLEVGLHAEVIQNIIMF